MHELRAKQIEDPDSVLAAEDEIPSEYCHKVQYGDSVPSEHPLPEHYSIDDLLENPLDESYLDEADAGKKGAGFGNVSEMLLEDAILDAYRNNMAATFEANETRGFSNELHLWDERYVYDAKLRVDADEGAERHRNLESDRINTENRRRAEEDANRRRMEDAADLARRRYDDDLNRR
jgi:hypothetical protein